jgi:hypothetical protein
MLFETKLETFRGICVGGPLAGTFAARNNPMFTVWLLHGAPQGYYVHSGTTWDWTEAKK